MKIYEYLIGDKKEREKKFAYLFEHVIIDINIILGVVWQRQGFYLLVIDFM